MDFSNDLIINLFYICCSYSSPVVLENFTKNYDEKKAVLFYKTA
jgi:hypothetical protein